MTEKILDQLWTIRLRKGREIADNAADYKECDQCRSILLKDAGICRFCGTYRFKESPEEVRATVGEMTQHAYPVSAGIIPRLWLEGGPGAPQLISHEDIRSLARWSARE